MIKIRADQMQSFGKLLRQRFVDSEVARVRLERPVQAGQVAEARIRQFVEQAIQRAAALHLVAVSDVQRFVDLSFRLGREFEEDPAHLQVRLHLEAFEVSGKLRLDRIDNMLADEQAS